MVAYHKMYKHIKPEVVELIKREIFKNRYYQKNKSEKKQILLYILKELSFIYRIKTPRIVFEDDPMGYVGGGRVTLSTDTICIGKKLSVITFLHEFKHCLQRKLGKPINERNARGWSLSVFYQANPQYFKRIVEEGKVLYMNKIDVI